MALKAETHQLDSVDFGLLAEYQAIWNEEEKETLSESLVRMFMEDTPALLSDVKDAFVSEREEDLRKFAHAFKGKCRNLGCYKMVEILDQIELHRCEESDISELEKEYEHVKGLLESFSLESREG